jgi:hypothetical protein
MMKNTHKQIAQQVNIEVVAFPNGFLNYRLSLIYSLL